MSLPQGKEKPIFYIMGVSGCGKTTIGKLLSKELSIPFFDGDDYHSASNVAKMASGTPLTDADRLDWLKALNTLAKKEVGNKGAIIACSALKEYYRDLLCAGLEEAVVWVFLKGTFEQISKRLEKRSGHYMPSSLLKSQFSTLEIPEDAIAVSITPAPPTIVAQIIEQYKIRQD